MQLLGPAGIDDILPNQIPTWNYLERISQEVFSRYGFSEIRLPIFEDIRVFLHNVGETTDIVEKGMFSFESGEDHYCLRPEGTASVVRAYLQHKFHKVKPFQKWFYSGPMFRHERTQRGRKWQFHQIGIEALGASNPLLDAEIISLGAHLFDELGVTDYRILLNTLGCSDCRIKYRSILKEELEKERKNLCNDCERRMDRNVFRVLDCKQTDCQSIANHLTKIQDILCETCQTNFNELLDALDSLEVSYEVAPRLVRGLDYYTGTVFEYVHSGLGSQNALGAGGRYDSLISQNGGPELGGAGFALGVERILLAMESLGVLKDIKKMDPLDVYLVSIGAETKKPLFKLAGKLRLAGIRTDLDHEGRSIKAQMRTANKCGAPVVLVLGEDELAANQITLKEMESGEESRIEFESVIQKVKETIKHETKTHPHV